MTDLALLVGSALLLVFFRWWIQKRAQGLVILLTGSQGLGIYLYSLVFLPGVMIHELAHFFCAALLGVRTGEIALLPRLSHEEEDERVILGSVRVAKTDFVRGSLIGAAPFFAGAVFLYVLARLPFAPLLTLGNGEGLRLFEPLTYVWLYATLAIANTMFPSREDSQAWPILGVFLGLFSLVVWWSGGSASLSQWLLPRAIVLAHALNASFIVAALFDGFLAAVLFVVEKVLERIVKRRIVY